ncbi:hypothetical protein CBL_04973 [Carabus blaptoides fortunei]
MFQCHYWKCTVRRKIQDRVLPPGFRKGFEGVLRVIQAFLCGSTQPGNMALPIAGDGPGLQLYPKNTSYTRFPSHYILARVTNAYYLILFRSFNEHFKGTVLVLELLLAYSGETAIVHQKYFHRRLVGTRAGGTCHTTRRPIWRTRSSHHVAAFIEVFMACGHQCALVRSPAIAPPPCLTAAPPFPSRSTSQPVAPTGPCSHYLEPRGSHFASSSQCFWCTATRHPPT